MTGTDPRHANGGFTLLEVLIAGTLLGVMMLLLTGSLRIGAESWDTGEERMARASRLFIVENFLRSHITSLLPVMGTRKNGQMEAAFRGGPDFLTYVAPLPEQVKAGGLYRFELYVSNDGEKKELRMAIRPYTTRPNQDPAGEPIDDLAILENIEEFKLSYRPQMFQTPNFGPTSPSNPPVQWTDIWEQQQVPALIRIDIEPADEEPWPTLFIAPKTTMLR